MCCRRVFVWSTPSGVGASTWRRTIGGLAGSSWWRLIVDLAGSSGDSPSGGRMTSSATAAGALCAPTRSRAAPSCPPHLARNHLFTPSKTAVLPLLWCQNTGRRAQNKHLRRCPSIASQHVSGSAPLSIAQQDPSLHSTQQQRESAPMIPSSALRCGGKTTSWGGSAQAHSWNQAQLQPRGIPWSRTARPEVS